MKLLAGILLALALLFGTSWAEDETSALLNSSNGICDSVNSWNNVYGTGIANALDGLPSPVTPESVAALGNVEKGRRLVAALEYLHVMIEDSNIGGRDYLTTLTNVGYASFAAAFADVPNRFAGQTATNIQMNLNTMNNAWLAAKAVYLDDAFIAAVLDTLQDVSGEYTGIVNGLNHE